MENVTLCRHYIENRKMIRKILVIVILGAWFFVVSNLDKFLTVPYPQLTSEEMTIAENLWQYPQPLPDGFLRIELWTYATGFVDRVCAVINPFVVWEPGDFDHDDSVNVRTNEFKVNNVVIRPSDRIYAEVTISVTRRENGLLSGKVLGSHGGPISVCFETENIPEGLNLAELRFKSTSGKLYSYNWAFKLTKENQIIHVALPDAITN